MKNLHHHSRRHLFAAILGFSCLVIVLTALLLTPRHEASSHLLTPPPAGLSMTTPETPLSYSPILTWDTDDEAVMYEIEFFTKKPGHLSPAKNSDESVFRTRSIYQNAYNAPLREFAADQLGSKTEPIYWRVRALDFNGTPAVQRPCRALHLAGPAADGCARADGRVRRQARGDASLPRLHLDRPDHGRKLRSRHLRGESRSGTRCRAD